MLGEIEKKKRNPCFCCGKNESIDCGFGTYDEHTGEFDCEHEDESLECPCYLTYCSDCKMFAEITKDIVERIRAQPNSLAATGDEVRICWLVGKVEQLLKEREILEEKWENQKIRLENQKCSILKYQTLLEECEDEKQCIGEELILLQDQQDME